MANTTTSSYGKLKNRGLNLTHAKAFHLLIVQEEPADLALALGAIQETRLSFQISTATSAAGLPGTTSRPGDRPDLILMNIDRLRDGGCDQLRKLKNDPSTRAIPVIVFSKAPAQPEIDTAYDCHANCCITTPQNFGEYVELMRTLASFWLGTVLLPPLHPSL